jgi:dipeptidyl aminopeptidase/acylaminoacyl peptidase
VSGGATRVLTKLKDGRFVVSRRLIDFAGGHNYVQVIAADGERRLSELDLRRGTLALRMRGYQSLDGTAFDRDGSVVAYVGQDPGHPPDVWAANINHAEKRRLTNLNPQLETAILGDAKSVSWTTKSGLHLDGSLLLPAGYEPGKRYPTITWIYAGEPEGTSVRTVFGLALSTQAPYFNLQLLASRGYAVFVPDTILHTGTPMQDIADQVLPGIDKLVDMGVADPARLGVYGQSYGGYSTLSLLVQSNRFATAVAMSGISDIFSMYGTMYDDGSDWTSWAESQQGRMGGTPWEQRQRYIDNSPFFFLDRVKTPVLLEYGQNDRFAAINWEQAFVSLRRLGNTVTLVRYAGEGHVLLRQSNQLDFCTRLFAWFNTYLKPMPQ